MKSSIKYDKVVLKEEWDNMDIDTDIAELLKDEEVIKWIGELVNMSDFEFYSKLCSRISDKEFKKFCIEFPEAKVIEQYRLYSKNKDCVND